MLAASCPDISQIQHLLAGQIPLPDAGPLLQHLKECSACAQAAKKLAGDTETPSSALNATLVKNPGQDFVERLVRRLTPAPPLQETLVGVPPVVPPPISQTMFMPAPAAPASSPAPQPSSGQFPQTQYFFLAPPQREDEIGRLAHYRVLKLLGEGGMGYVFKAEDSQLDRIVALKVMKPRLSAEEGFEQRFLREAKTTASLKSDHIITIYQAGKDRDLLFLAMEFLQGESLETWLQKDLRPSAAHILRIGREIATGLAAAHLKGLIHRDIKPANLWLEQMPSGQPGGNQYRVKILDFGLARAQDDQQHLTQTGMVVGTPAYMAPEQADGEEEVDHRSDLFSLGGVLYHLCSGTQPFPGRTTMAVLAALANHTPQPLGEINPSLPQPLVDLVAKLLSKDPAQRPESAQAVVNAIHAIERSLAAKPAGASNSAVRTNAEQAKPAVPQTPPVIPQHPREIHPEPAASLELPEEPGLQPLEGSPDPPPAPKSPAAAQGTEPNRPSQVAPEKRKPAVKTAEAGQETERINPSSGEKRKPAAKSPPSVSHRRPPEKAESRDDSSAKGPRLGKRAKPPATPKPKQESDSSQAWLIGAGAAASLLIIGLVVFLVVRGGEKDGAEDVEPDGRKGLVSEPPKPGPLSEEDWLKQTAALAPEKQAEAVAARLKELNQGFDGKIGRQIDKDAVVQLSFSTEHIADVRPVRALSRLIRLDINGAGPNRSKFSDLKQLSGLALGHLAAPDTSITDLTPLQGMPLDSLNIDRTQVSDLSPLRGMKITRLQISGTPVEDLSPLRELPLRQLNLTFTANRGDKAVLRAMPLETINGKRAADFWKEVDPPPAVAKVDDAWIKAVAALAPPNQLEAVSAKLKELNTGFDGTLKPNQAGNAIHTLALSTQHVADISPLRALKELRVLGLAGSDKPVQTSADRGKLADLSPLKGLALQSFICQSNPVTDLSPLKGMPLVELGIINTPVSDLSPLSGLKLISLDIGGTEVTSLAPLKGMPLRRLFCAKTRITDLKPLEGMPLEGVLLTESKVTDLSPLQALRSLTEIFSPNLKPERPELEYLKAIKTLKKINGRSSALFWREFDPVLRKKP